MILLISDYLGSDFLVEDSTVFFGDFFSDLAPSDLEEDRPESLSSDLLVL